MARLTRSRSPLSASLMGGRGLARRPAVIGLVAVAILVLVVALDLLRAITNLNAARAHLLQAEQQLTTIATPTTSAGAAPGVAGSPTTAASRGVTAAHTSLASAAAELRTVDSVYSHYRWLLRIAGALPLLGSSVSAEEIAITHMLAAGVDATDGAAIALQGVLPLAEAVERSGNAGMDQLLATSIPALQTAAPQFIAAQQRLDSASSHIAALDSLAQGVPPRALRAGLPALARLVPRLAQARLATTVLPRLADALPAAQNGRYAVISQKTAELRATGGFWGNVGLLTLQQGRLGDVDYLKSVETDNPNRLRVAPPAPLTRYMQIDQWVLRDANWWPDFPTSAAQFRAFLQEDMGRDVDGVIVFDEETLTRLLAALGPIQVPDYAERIDAGNVQERLEYYAYGPGQLHENGVPRPFFAAVTEALSAKLLNIPKDQAPGVLAALGSLLAERHIQIASTQPSVAGLLADLGWDGRLDSSSDGDYLYVVDTNVDYAEPFPKVEQTIDYELTLDPAGATGPDGGHSAILTLTYQNTNTERESLLFSRRIKRDLSDYVRVYVPAGSELLRTTGLDGQIQSWDEGGRTVFGGHFALRAGDRTQVTFEYRLPDSILHVPPPPGSELATAPRAGQVSAAADPAAPDAPVYVLSVQRQPGAPIRPVTVTLRSAGAPRVGTLRPEAPRQAWSLQPGAFAAAGQLAPSSSGTASVPGVLAQYRFQLQSDVRLVLPSAIASRPASGAFSTASWSTGLPLLWLRPLRLVGQVAQLIPNAPRPLGRDAAPLPGFSAPAAPAASVAAGTPAAPAAPGAQPGAATGAAPAANPPGSAQSPASAATRPGQPAGPVSPGAAGSALATAQAGAPASGATSAQAPGTTTGPVGAASARVGFGPIIPLPPPQRVRIAKLNLDAPITQTGHDGQVWITAENAVGWLVGTASPGERNNVVLTAHNDTKGALFARLGDLALGDEVTVESGAGAFRYRVTSQPTTVSPGDLSVLYPTRTPSLTLITCTPSPANERRLVVRAQLLQ